MVHNTCAGRLRVPGRLTAARGRRADGTTVLAARDASATLAVRSPRMIDPKSVEQVLKDLGKALPGGCRSTR